MRIAKAKIMKDGNVVMDNVAGDLIENTYLIITGRGMLPPGNYELVLQDGTSEVMRSGVPSQYDVGANAAYFTLRAVWNNYQNPN